MIDEVDQMPEFWLKMESEVDLKNALEKSKHKPVVIFKHSTRCGISSSAKRRLAKDFNLIKDDVSFYYLDLIQYRNLSNQIAHDLKVRHESPQVILVSDSKTTFHGSHEGVSIETIQSALSQS